MRPSERISIHNMAKDMRLQISQATFEDLMRRKKTLFNHTADSIFKNLNMLVNKDADFRMQIETLPMPLRAEMLPRLTKLKCRNPDGDLTQFEIMLNGFEALLTSKTTEIKLNGLLTFCPRGLKLEKLAEVVRIIVKNAPDLETLVINDRSLKCELDYYVNFEEEYGKDTLEEISKLRNLKKLCIHSCLINYSDLLKLCKKLPALEYLDVIFLQNYNCLTFGYEEMTRETFGNLKVFLFDGFGSDSFIMDLSEFCIENLPKLEIVQRRVDHYMYFTMHIAKYIDLNLNCESSPLQHLCTEPLDKSLHLLFPKLTHLQVNLANEFFSESEKASVMNFSGIEYLCISRCCSSLDIVDRLLDTYGPNLKSLEFSESFCSIKLETIFEKCPNLEKLSLHCVEVTDEDKPISNFSNLKELVWIRDQYDEPAVLSNILSAPNLEKISLEGSKFDASDLKKVADLIAKKQILRHLKSFHHVNVNEYVLTRSKSKFVKALTSLIKNATTFIPNFTDVEIDINFKRFCFKRFSFHLSSDYL
ncbi:Hypothetical predicted protein [Cloeon dipterum]|uniref:F-box domain-containing protein n=1 Tax=Cloeon dipterum TaxID=197152 RepID=A0A8S1D3W0_9INSE|nr:Hypothetical predicted protein [Cloeon dipterum]